MNNKHRMRMVPLCLILAACSGGGVSVSQTAAPPARAEDAGNHPTPPVVVDSSSPAGETQPPVSLFQGGATTVRFALKAGDTTAACGAQLSDIGLSHASAKLTEGLIYVHDVALIAENGQEVPLQLDQHSPWQYLNLALLDFAGGSCKTAIPLGDTPIDGSNQQVVGNVPSGNYTGLSFKVGVPISAKAADGSLIGLNHQAAHSAPHPILGVYWVMWEWQSGHRFMRIDLAPNGGVKRADASNEAKWAFHLGSTDCRPNRNTPGGYLCGKPNRFKVAFQRFNPNEQQVTLDIRQLFADNDISRDDSDDAGCKSNVTDQQCRPIFQQLGLRLDDSSANSKDGGLQIGSAKAFRLEKLGT